jgi:hypothetical protein
MRVHAATLAATASKILLALPEGAYDPEIRLADTFLRGLGLQGQVADAVLHVLLAINAATAPKEGVVPDNQGGYIPAHGQSEYDPVTGAFTGKKT